MQCSAKKTSQYVSKHIVQCTALKALLSIPGRCEFRLMVPFQVVTGVAEVNISSNKTVIRVFRQLYYNTTQWRYKKIQKPWNLTELLFYCNFDFNLM